MKMLRWILEPFAVFGLVAICLNSCSPVPVIQSARVRSGGGISMNVNTQSENVRIHAKDSVSGSIGRYSNGIPARNTFTIPTRDYLKVGFLDRVEVGVGVMPFLNGSLKLALFDIGENRLFRNVSTALLADGVYPSKVLKTVTGGVITGTHCNVISGDLEVVLMATGTSFRYQYEDDQSPNCNLYYKTADFSLGCIYSPTKSGFFAVTAGVTGRLLLNKSCSLVPYSDNLYYEIRELSVSPVVFQFGMQLFVTGTMLKKLSGRYVNQ